MPAKTPDDLQLAELLRQGDETAFTTIYNRYWEKLLAIAYHHTRDKAEAEEILQEVFLSLWRRREIVCVQSLSAYLATAVKYAVFKSLQLKRRRLEIERQEYSTEPTVENEASVDALFLRDYLNGVIEQLPEKCRLVFKYSRETGMTIPQIALQMNISEKTVESHLTKALKTIRLKLHNSGILMVIISIF